MAKRKLTEAQQAAAEKRRAELAERLKSDHDYIGRRILRCKR